MPQSGVHAPVSLSLQSLRYSCPDDVRLRFERTRDSTLYYIVGLWIATLMLMSEYGRRLTFAMITCKVEMSYLHMYLCNCQGLLSIEAEDNKRLAGSRDPTVGQASNANSSPDHTFFLHKAVAFV